MTTLLIVAGVLVALVVLGEVAVALNKCVEQPLDTDEG